MTQQALAKSSRDLGALPDCRAARATGASRRCVPAGLTRAGFTLIELMVAIAIIAVLIAIALPAFNSVRKQALVTATSAFFQAMSTGNDVFRADQSIGGSYIPSHTDSTSDPASIQFSEIDNPMAPNGALAAQTTDMIFPITGASLLVYGLAGADSLGTPGFKSLPDGNQSNYWYEDFGTWDATSLQGLHNLDDTQNMKPSNARYGPYIDSKGLEKIRSFNQLLTENVIATPDNAMLSLHSGKLMDQLTFVDAWDRPILYYRAQRSANTMVTDPGPPLVVGVYDLRDNQHLTGFSEGNVVGTDFGAGVITDTVANGQLHGISLSKFPEADPTVDDLRSGFEYHFEEFIWDRSVTQRNVPVNRETFLLISAGPDARYGTADDITNWTRDR